MFKKKDVYIMIIRRIEWVSDREASNLLSVKESTSSDEEAAWVELPLQHVYDGNVDESTHCMWHGGF